MQLADIIMTVIWLQNVHMVLKMYTAFETQGAFLAALLCMREPCQWLHVQSNNDWYGLRLLRGKLRT